LQHPDGLFYFMPELGIKALLARLSRSIDSQRQTLGRYNCDRWQPELQREVGNGGYSTHGEAPYEKEIALNPTQGRSRQSIHPPQADAQRFRVLPPLTGCL
jgi:hypothetical protein